MIEVRELPGGCLLYAPSRFVSVQPPDDARQERARNEAADSAAMMPFGKYRGAPLDVVVDDVPYCEWLLRQAWFGEKFPRHRKYLIDCLSRTRDDADGPSAA